MEDDEGQDEDDEDAPPGEGEEGVYGKRRGPEGERPGEDARSAAALRLVREAEVPAQGDERHHEDGRDGDRLGEVDPSGGEAREDALGGEERAQGDEEDEERVGEEGAEREQEPAVIPEPDDTLQGVSEHIFWR